uniref:Uncharacterized protein n=1 Tax=Anguilla anguilla TaxID=7936 RepID=A0A0E9TFB3_ANGAN
MHIIGLLYHRMQGFNSWILNFIRFLLITRIIKSKSELLRFLSEYCGL